ncbi:MAG: hypothetical protein ABW118_08565 [Candidatus Thiodiazotropha sp.]
MSKVENQQLDVRGTLIRAGEAFGEYGRELTSCHRSKANKSVNEQNCKKIERAFLKVLRNYFPIGIYKIDGGGDIRVASRLMKLGYSESQIEIIPLMSEIVREEGVKEVVRMVNPHIRVHVKSESVARIAA